MRACAVTPGSETLAQSGEQQGQAEHVLAVVPRHLRQQVSSAGPQIGEVTGRDQCARQVVPAAYAGNARLHGPQARVSQPVAPQLASDRQEVEVACSHGFGARVKPEPCHQEWPVETTTVVRDQPRIRRNR